jgi:hypothetical protein
MLKVHILDRCEFCLGEAYVFVGEFADEDGNRYPRYLPCHVCEGTGERGKWVSLPDFLEMLKATQCKHEHTSYQGGMHFYAGDVWDDIQEVCNDCGANLDRRSQDDK